MEYEISVDFGHDEVFTMPVAVDPTSETIAGAQRWLDGQFVELGCEPLRPTGKVLTADKTLAIAMEAGARRFRENPAWSNEFARAVALALNRAVVRIKVADRTVGY